MIKKIEIILINIVGSLVKVYSCILCMLAAGLNDFIYYDKDGNLYHPTKSEENLRTIIIFISVTCIFLFLDFIVNFINCKIMNRKTIVVSLKKCVKYSMIITALIFLIGLIWNFAGFYF